MVNGFKNIEQKLHQFTRKYYTSELIKGTILFLSLGCLYFFFTLFLEYFLWLKTTARTLLFWFFLGVELFLLIRFIVLPVFKLIGLRAGITAVHSSKIIGRHFPEVQDKLLNVLQLKQNANKSDLLAASIDQKAHELQSVPFVKAVDFTQNKKFLKYAIIPVLILLVTLFSGNRQVFTSSLERIVNHRTSYIPPAPFSFSLKEKKLQGKYPYIQEGDKIKFLHMKIPNTYQSSSISFMTKLPKELNLLFLALRLDWILLSLLFIVIVI